MAGTGVSVLGFPGLNLVDSNQANYNYGQLPPDQALEEQALNRRQHIANLLIQQGLANAGANHGQMVGRFYVPGSPVQNLAGLASIAAGAYGTSKNDQARKGLTDSSNAMLAQAVQDYHNKMADVPAVPGSDPKSSSSEQPVAQLDRLLGPGADQSNLPQTIPNNVNFGQGEGPSTHPMTGAPLGEPPTTPPIPPGEGVQIPEPQQREQVAQALMQQAQQPVQGPMSPGTPARPRTPEERQQALIDLMANPHPQAQALGRLLQQQQAAQEEHRAQREFTGSQNEMNRDVQLQKMDAQFSQMVAMGLMSKEAKDAALAQAKDLAQKHNETLLGIAKIGAQAKTDVQGMKSGPNRPMSATAQKELIQTEEELQGSHQAVEHLKSALSLNDKAMGFTGAGALAGAGSFLPDAIRPKAIDATVDLENLIQGSALPQLKAIFGGMPTEGERKILLDVSGSASKTPSQRKAIFERAIQGAQNRITFNTQKAEQLRKGSYFSGDGGIDTSAAPNPVSPLVGGGQQAAPSGVPPGAKQIGTSGGKPVYQLPDGSKVIAE